MRHQCRDFTDQDTRRCVEQTTYNFTELVEDSWLENPKRPTDPKSSLMDEPGFWKRDFTLAWPGMCFTLTKKDPERNNLIHLFLNTSLTFIVFVHDPEYFLYTYNPKLSP